MAENQTNKNILRSKILQDHLLAKLNFREKIDPS
jgi:hypothetical protein